MATDFLAIPDFTTEELLNLFDLAERFLVPKGLRLKLAGPRIPSTEV